MKYTKVPETTFQKLQLNAGILLRSFDPETATVERAGIVGATTGGVNFTATPSYSDFGDDIDNVPANMKELKKLDSWAVSMGGTFVTIDVAGAKSLMGAADVSENKITPRNDLLADDFEDLWWVGDYSDENSEESGGFIAIHMMNTLSTGGLSIRSTDNGKGNFAFTYTAHYSMDDPDKVPFEVYVQAGESAEAQAEE